MARTSNKYWLYLESLRKSGITNMYGAAPFLMKAFGLEREEAKNILADWMKNYNAEDYEEVKNGKSKNETKAQESEK